MIYHAIFSWNEFLYSLLFMTKPAMKTVPLAPIIFVQTYTADWGPVFAALVIISVPLLAIYLLLSEYFVEGLAAGALKG
jgi:ABC-type glycerol-3-phosphate transport system permease component